MPKLLPNINLGDMILLYIKYNRLPYLSRLVICFFYFGRLSGAEITKNNDNVSRLRADSKYKIQGGRNE